MMDWFRESKMIDDIESYLCDSKYRTLNWLGMRLFFFRRG